MFNILRKPPKCDVCGNKMTELQHELRLRTEEGTLNLSICEECSVFLDKSAEVLMKKRSKEDE